MGENLLQGPLTAGQIRTFIDFDGGSATGSAQSRTQSDGVAALWHLLQTKNFAYLADEVGMGKTRQAMAVIALQLLEKPEAQIVIVCPGKPLQEQWKREWDAFTRTCWLARDDRLRSKRTGRSVSPIVLHDRLSDFALALQRGHGRIHLLRYSSFSRPLWFGRPIQDGYSLETMYAAYAQELAPLGAVPSPEDQEALEKAHACAEATATERFGTFLQGRYAARIGQLLCARGIGLAVFDEAQYLRHVGNQQNRHILGVFHPHAQRWLFLSATPLHSGPQSLACLDTYLAPAPNCACTCTPGYSSPRIAQRLRPGTPETQDVVAIMQEFMVRRIRTYEDAEGKAYPKTEYRRYERVRTSSAADPFMTLTMALVQKRLVMALDGKQNRFRQGECSSFESLATSMRAHWRRNAENSPEFEHRDDGGPAQSDESMDRASIDALTVSFHAAASHLDPQPSDGAPSPRSLPHAKLSEVVRQVAERSLKDGSTHKSLVFVRRLDTVEELRDALLHEFQKEVDGRLTEWRKWLLKPPEGVTLREQPWLDGQFWSTPPHKEDDNPVEPDERDYPDEEDGHVAVPPLSLDYFKAIQEKGKLSSFQARLRNKSFDRNPLRGFLQTRLSEALPSDEGAWATANDWWARFLRLCIGKEERGPEGADPWRTATLKRCLLQSMRQTDLLVDLYVLNRYVNRIDHQPQALPDLLLRFLAGDAVFPLALTTYAANWRERFRRWIVEFDTIIDKCLRGDNATEWHQLHEKANSAFDRMQPVFGRSGRLKDKNAVTQFKFPSHPNVLVCTDVLKEGVDLHLFCDEVVHYGVAWTSGDLEQRIGRVDRFGSKISRQIAAFRPSSDSEVAPRLQVKFPYLDGTLDAPQVARVILAKVRSDLRMDMKRHHDDMGKISLEDLLDPDRNAEPENTIPMRAVFFPDDRLPRDADDVEPQPPERIASLLGNALNADGVHFPHLGALRRRCESPEDPLSAHSLLRAVAAPNNRNRFNFQAEWLEAEEAGAPTSNLAAQLRKADPLSVQALEGNHGFSFDAEWNTLAYVASVDHPLAVTRASMQTVLLEQLTGFWLLRVPLFAADTAHDTAWLARHNLKLEWCYLACEHGVVWLLQFIAQVAVDGTFLKQVAGRLGALGGCLRTSFGMHSVGSYRSRTSLPSMAGLNYFSLNERKVAMANDQWEEAGQFLEHLQLWFRNAFEAVLKSLEQEASQSVMQLRSDGVLHLVTEGPGRVRLQVFLSSQWVVWELISTTAILGRPPTLKASLWEEMPHISMEGWEGEKSEDCMAYVGASDQYRYAAVYHRPHAWDRHNITLLAAWQKALQRMQSNNFQRRALVQSFLEAVHSR
ncbi:DEAD/DEAH box helicase [Comamonas piscis]|uniref:DEAD/DEAH box helicase n=1 Tax=Comamonas piscis TaxID=1562974 RepID=A0A7G5EM17_9BURK|nr:DEAD/DEAH box helicase [Comamonas piscis]QMV75042.1 DEAD/DEAH box helicase [Comamonas piscis]WSO33523.1 DEAD/DEAH box helicase [Comamonas piscis]